MSHSEAHKLRHTFIAMLFAFVVSVLAIKAVDLLSVITSDWNAGFSISQIGSNLLHADFLLIVPFMHLLLAFMLVSMSWVMWSRSQSSGLTKQIDSFISIPFFILLIEMLLVVMYFALTNTVEQDIAAYNNSKRIEDFVKNPSAQPEAHIFIFVFSIWFIWDIVCDVLASNLAKAPQGFISSIMAPIQGVLTYSSASFMCLLACIIVSQVVVPKDPIKVIFADLALLSVLIWFRPAKKIEYFWIKFFPNEATRQNTRHDQPLTVKEVILLVGPILFFFVCLYFSSGFNLCLSLQS